MREERDAAVDEPERSRDGRIPLFGVGKTNDFAFAEVVAAAVTPELREFSVVIFAGAGAFDAVESFRERLGRSVASDAGRVFEAVRPSGVDVE